MLDINQYSAFQPGKSENVGEAAKKSYALETTLREIESPEGSPVVPVKPASLPPAQIHTGDALYQNARLLASLRRAGHPHALYQFSASIVTQPLDKHGQKRVILQ
jgi:hypothetical protein